MRETSLIAHRELSDTVSEKQRVALDTLARLGTATAKELDEAAGTVGLWKRLSELKALGLATECDVRRCRITNHLALVWRVRSPSEPAPPEPKPKRRRWFVCVNTRGAIYGAYDSLDDARDARDAFAERYDDTLELAIVREVRKTF